MTDRMVIIGFGNLLMGDDGVGVHVARRLAGHGLPAGAEALDGGVSSLDVLGSVLDAGKVIIVDALAGGGEPGAIYRLTPADLGEASSPVALSLHDFSLMQAIELLGRTAVLPPIVIFGIEPDRIELGLELTPAVAEAAARVADLILAEVWGECHA